jgi:hypothetical protein
MNTFRLKAKTDFKDNMLSSSLNPFARTPVRVEKITNETGTRKKAVNDWSFKKTDPLSLKY